MFSVFAVAATLAAYSDYPGALSRQSSVEAYTDKGLTVELVVRCRPGTGVLTYSKADQTFCDSRLRCHSSLRAARRATCAGH